jgi:O-antigen ligase
MWQAQELTGNAIARSDASASEKLTLRLEFAFACAAVFFAPVNVLKLPAFYFTMSDAFTCLCLVAMLLARTIRPGAIGPGTAYWTTGLLIMVAALFVSSLFVGSVDRGIILSVQYLFAYFLLPLVLLGRPWRQTDILMKVFIASMVIMTLHGIYVVDFVGERFTVFVSGSGRLQGFVERENECGSLYALTAPIVLSMAARRSIRPVVALIVMLLFGYGTMLTGSNTALYGLLFGLIVFVLATLTTKRILQVAAFGLAFWVVLSSPQVREFLPEVFQKRVLTGLESGSLSKAGTFSDRLQLINEAIRLGEHATLLGYGADQYREISEWHAPVHNLYLLIWNEGGLFALAGFVMMLSGAVITILAAWRFRQIRAEVACGFSTLVLFAMLVNATPHVYGRFWTVPVLLSLAPVIAFLNERPQSRKFGSQRRRS